MNKVSVIVPIYNNEKYLKQCLDSILNQTLKDIEIICVNDGSTDGSFNILQTCATADSRINIINQSNHGYGYSMNAGLREATGEYIGIVESDDFIDCDMYECMYEKAKIHNADIVKANYWLYDGASDNFSGGLAEGPYDTVFKPREENKAIFLRGQSIWSAIYRKEFLSKNHIRFLETPGASYQDTSFYILTMAFAERVALVKDAYLHYRTDNPNSSVKSSGKVFSICDEFEFVWKFLDKSPNVKKSVQYILPETQKGIYEWNYNRLRFPFNFIFLKRMREDFLELLKKGLLRRSYWREPENFDDAIALIRDGDKFIFDRLSKEQRKVLYARSFIAELRESDIVYIYGAGLVGKEIFSVLKKFGVNVTGVLVSSTKNNPESLEGAPVFSIRELPEKDRSAPIVISVKESSQTEILNMLVEAGYEKVLLVQKELREGLMEYGANT